MGLQQEPAPSRAQAAASYGKRQLDRVVSPAARQNAYDATLSFASDRPILFAFMASQLFFSLLPVVLFVSFAVSTTLFALVAAVVFALFWVGVATLFLVPTLCLTGTVALLVWLWVVAALVVARWVYHLLPRAPPPSGSKQAAARNRSKHHEQTHGNGTYTGGDTEYRDALVKSENEDATD